MMARVCGCSIKIFLINFIWLEFFLINSIFKFLLTKSCLIFSEFLVLCVQLARTEAGNVYDAAKQTRSRGF